MLKNIDPLLNADVLRALRAMGHGDVLVMSDANFPSESTAEDTVYGELLRIDAGAARAAEAILSVFPLDSFVDHPAQRMEVQGDPNEVPAVQREVQEVVKRHEGGEIEGVERFRFYDMAKECYCVITTSEYRPWGCFMFKKGVVFHPKDTLSKHSGKELSLDEAHEK